MPDGPAGISLFMNVTDDLSHQAFAKGWKEKTIGISAMDGYTDKILFMVVDRSSRLGWRAAKWVHRAVGIAAVVLAFKFSWLWLLLLLPAFFVRRAYYEEARKEIGQLCAKSDNAFIFVKNSGLVIISMRG